MKTFVTAVVLFAISVLGVHDFKLNWTVAGGSHPNCNRRDSAEEKGKCKRKDNFPDLLCFAIEPPRFPKTPGEINNILITEAPNYCVDMNPNCTGHAHLKILDGEGNPINCVTNIEPEVVLDESP